MNELSEKEIKKEIRIRKLVIKKLETAIRDLNRSVETQKKKKRDRLERLMEYKTYEEAHEAYGYGFLTEQEFYEVQDLLEEKENKIEAPGVEECAARILLSLEKEMYSDIRSFEFELLPQKERTRILEENYARLKNDQDAEHKGE